MNSTFFKANPRRKNDVWYLPVPLVLFFRYHDGGTRSPDDTHGILKVEQNRLNAEYLIRRKIIPNVGINDKPPVLCFDGGRADLDMVLVRTLKRKDMRIKRGVPIRPMHRRPYVFFPFERGERNARRRHIGICRKYRPVLSANAFRKERHCLRIKRRYRMFFDLFEIFSYRNSYAYAFRRKWEPRERRIKNIIFIPELCNAGVFASVAVPIFFR